ncbi:hypothetical protein E2C01_066955 [Portunus trituberculatus]|uniref:Uncharacterized protein n=1 Tax=Portunus trituberculatus TaxID=210409 RepID=A0A5B7HRE6_PORTR|nr:hypothetical protein [Portunus trituberculatus]
MSEWLWALCPELAVVIHHRLKGQWNGEFTSANHDMGKMEEEEEEEEMKEDKEEEEMKED